MRDDSKDLASIDKKLSFLISILWNKDSGEGRTTQSSIEKLRRFGFTNSEIANILGTTKRTVEVVVSRLGMGEKRTK